MPAMIDFRRASVSAQEEDAEWLVLRLVKLYRLLFFDPSTQSGIGETNTRANEYQPAFASYKSFAVAMVACRNGSCVEQIYW